VTDDDTVRLHPHYGTCDDCRQLKHVTADGLVHDHNKFRSTGTAVASLRCGGSGTRYQEHPGSDGISA